MTEVTPKVFGLLHPMALLSFTQNRKDVLLHFDKQKTSKAE